MSTVRWSREPSCLKSTGARRPYSTTTGLPLDRHGTTTGPRTLRVNSTPNRALWIRLGEWELEAGQSHRSLNFPVRRLHPIVGRFRRCFARYFRRVTSREQREDQSEAHARGLIDLIKPQFPVDLPPLGSADAWQLTGPGLIARQVGSLEAIFYLRSLEREADPAILSRALYEHAVTFAWLAADPGAQRHQRFVKSDLLRRLEIDDDCRQLTHDGVPVEIMNTAERRGFAQQLTNLPEGTKRMPDLIDMATAADEHWTEILEPLTGSATVKSYRGFYGLTYRHESSIAHATSLGLNPVWVVLVDGGRRVQLEERREDSQGPFGRAALIFGFTVMIAGESLSGWPGVKEVEAVFAV